MDMELDLTDGQELFAQTTAKFLDDKASPDDLRALRHDPTGFSSAYWRQGAELGWTSLLVSEADGGGSISGGGVSDLALVSHQFGRYAAPGPLLPTNIVAAALSQRGSPEQKAAVLPGLLSGETVGTWCWAEPTPNDRLGNVAMTASVTDGGYVLNGRKGPVEAGAQADHLLVVADTDGSPVQLLVPAGTPGVTVVVAQGLDLTRRYAEIHFEDVQVPRASLLGDTSSVVNDIEWQLQLANVIQMHEMVGAMEKAFEITMEWMFNRYSFGRPLASYQELKHRCADMKAWIEVGHGIADTATLHVQGRGNRAGEYASAGKAYLGVYGVDVLQDCVQIHGGIGVTFDHDMHLYLRRVVVDSLLFGTVSDHRQRLTTLLEEREVARA
jgi:alkylation response protein AidB-like acyl-CoA dehydrogenase